MQRVGRTIQVALFITGFALIVIGVLYLMTPVEALPSVLGGMRHGGIHAGAYHTKRADVGLILGIVALIASGWLYARSSRIRATLHASENPPTGWHREPST
jgi:divalent metal cation (Fe/Co/Zn/Cd) transporter